MTALPICHLRLFGTPSLESGDGNPLTGRAAQRHRLALLALLALAPGRRLSRDKVIAYLWPDSNADRARNLLNVSVYTIRKAVGESALVSTVDDLWLDTDVIAVDAVEFQAAIEQGDNARAAALYRGPLLDGFFLADAPELEQWVDRERKRLAADFDRALEGLADAAEQAGDFARAVDWWKARAANDPYDSRVALRLMRALESSGNRAGALQHASLHERLLREELGVAAPPAAVRELVDQLRREPEVPPPSRGATREISALHTRQAPVSTEPRAPEMVASDRSNGSRSMHDDGRRRQLRRWLARLAPVAAVAAAAAVWAARPSGDPPPGKSIVVLPFVNLSADQNNEYFADGLTEEVSTRLAAVPGLKVISRTTAMHYKGSRQPLREIASELNVAELLEGSVRLGGGRVRVTVQLIDAATDVHRWADSFESPAQGSFRLQEDVARAVAQALEVELSDATRRQLVRRGTSSPEAYDLYQRGRVLWQTRTRDGHEQAIQLYQRAIALDSGFADAYAGLADAYLTGYQNNVLALSESEAYARQKWASERALALDPESAAAHTSLANVLWWQQNWPGAMRELRRSLELNPGQAMTRSWYSLLLRATGSTREATEENRRAYELDPYAVAIVVNAAWHCYNERDFACALEQYRRAAAISTYPTAHVGLALTATQLGRSDEAIRAASEAVAMAPQRPEFVADLAYVQAKAGRSAEARASLRRATEGATEPFNVARAFVGLGQPDSAFAWLGRARWQWPHRAMLSDPALDPLRSDPRFQVLTARIRREMGLN